MNKISKYISTILLALIMIMSININKTYAASATLSASSTNVTVGTTVTLTATVTAGAWNVTISGNGVNQQSVGHTDTVGNKTTTVSATFNPKSAGTYTFNLTGDMTDFSEENARNVSDSITITATEPTTPDNGSESNTGSSSNNDSNSNTGSSGNSGGSSSTETRYPTETKPQTTKTEQTKSSNNYLSGLTVGTGTLSPEFYRETYEYTVEFDDTVNLYDLKEIEISATAEDERATVEGAGTIKLNDGENSITLTVKAENGSERTYTVKVVKPMPVEQSALRLKTLVLNGININGEYQTINIEFNPETFDYEITVPNEITALSINPTTENEDILIETTGGESLNEGSNKIIIMLTSPSDETVKTTYTLNVERQAALVTNEQGLTKEQIGIIIIASVVGVILLIVIIVAIVKHHKKKKGFDYDDDEDDGEMHFINNEEGEDVEDYNDVEDPYPSKIITSEEKDNSIKESANNDALNEIESNKNVNEELKLKTTYDEENIVSEDTIDRKSKWDDFVKGYDEEDEEPKTNKKKHGKRFL